jgi:hypothetical protein
MPFKSQAQRRWMRAAVARGEIDQATFDEWEAATPPGKLPERANPSEEWGGYRHDAAVDTYPKLLSLHRTKKLALAAWRAHSPARTAERQRTWVEYVANRRANDEAMRQRMLFYTWRKEAQEDHWKAWGLEGEQSRRFYIVYPGNVSPGGVQLYAVGWTDASPLYARGDGEWTPVGRDLRSRADAKAHAETAYLEEVHHWLVHGSEMDKHNAADVAQKLTPAQQVQLDVLLEKFGKYANNPAPSPAYPPFRPGPEPYPTYFQVQPPGVRVSPPTLAPPPAAAPPPAMAVRFPTARPTTPVRPALAVQSAQTPSQPSMSMAVRPNPGVGPHREFGERNVAPTKRSHKLPKKAAERYESSHWGIEASKSYDYPDEVHMPAKLVEMGKLVELRIDTTGKSQGQKKGNPNRDMHFPQGCHLAFATTEDEGLYCVLTPAVKKRNRKLLTDDGLWFSLDELADMAGGRQADWSYPDVQVQCLGVCTDVVYATEKQGDGPSEYIHAFGEESGTKPLLGVDEDGGLWFAGGAYTVPDEGITD